MYALHAVLVQSAHKDDNCSERMFHILICRPYTLCNVHGEDTKQAGLNNDALLLSLSLYICILRMNFVGLLCFIQVKLPAHTTTTIRRYVYSGTVIDQEKNMLVAPFIPLPA